MNLYVYEYEYEYVYLCVDLCVHVRKKRHQTSNQINNIHLNFVIKFRVSLPESE